MTFRKPIDSSWSNAINMLEQAERLHRQFFRLSSGRSTGPSWEPPVDIFETGHTLSVLVALPGVDSDHVKVVIDGNTLVVLAQRAIPAPVSAQIRRMEIPYGHFERHIELPSGHFDIQETTLSNGCLFLRLLKRA
ncbi:Hsp20/alpha crystallin family protein [Alcaligenaceae bacterium]|nr:Hsp20/alpha crystallin family protein [Alcaligenaceae bacterium]